MPYKLFKYVFLITIIANALACSSQQVKKPAGVDSLAKAWDKTIPGNFSGQLKTVFDSTQIVAFFKRYPEVKSYEDQLKSFYSNRKYAYAWFDDGDLIEQAGNLANRVEHLQNDGVYKPIYYQKELDSLLNLRGTKNQPDITLELMLTSQYFVFAKLAWQGMNTAASKSARWYLPRKKLDYEQYLDSLLVTSNKQLSSQPPVYRQYELLRRFLRKYRALDTKYNWLPIENKKVLRSGNISPTIALIKSRLYKLEDFMGDTINTTYNDTLVGAIKQFQNRHGLWVSGVVDRPTMDELNVPLKTRIRQLLVNMERSRWLPVTLSSDYLAVNIPEFKLHVYHADSLLWSCDAVVGQTVHQTTLFYGEVKYIVFSPYWNVPPSIVRNEIIPGLRRDPDYIGKHNMEITGHLNGLPTVRQKPGPENSLGLVKFLFPNSYNTYLHDTPSKSLFGETSRAFSHGCIRIANPVGLANFLLKDDKAWDAAKINTAMHLGKERYVTLTGKVPVFIAYFTAFTDRDNHLNFRKDIYNLDERLASMIMSGNGIY